MSLETIATVSLILGGACAVVIAADLFVRPQKMWIMHLVWPITALYAGPLALWSYFIAGRSSARLEMPRNRDEKNSSSNGKSFWQTAGVATLHCGAGCALGDLVAEWALLLVPFAIFGREIFAAWVVDYILAFGFGIVFQYFTIAPMRGLGFGDGIKAALKADSLSLTAWQIGMYGWMALAVFVIFRQEIPKTDPVFWFMMQIAMLCGFLTSYPVNWWLLRAGIKEKM